PLSPILVHIQTERQIILARRHCLGVSNWRLLCVSFVCNWCPMSVDIQTKNAVTVAGMARILGLSRSRFYQLMGTAFPLPVYDPATHRPFYSQDLQEVCQQVRRKNCGIDGKPILFYSKG